ncbi:MAG: nitrogen fixation protein NifX [Gammaproteobacteria bacterium]|nr:nitrogen fixation protein NifX [Gammaproteobacteria bacterium]
MMLQRRLQLLDTTEASWMSTAIKVAFATTDMKHVDQHFGAARSFAVYAIDPEQARFVEANEFGQLDMDGNEDKLEAKIEALAGCVAVYSQAVGASAINKLKARGIQPVKVSPGANIEELIEALQQELREGPSHWLARAIAETLPADPARFDAMEAEGWEE